jgi:prolyl oligopeptidase family protein
MSRTQTWPKPWLRNFPVNIFKSAALARRTRLILLASLAALACATVAAAQEHSSNSACPPPTRKDATVDTLHGVSIPDPYRWLEDQDSPETRAWIEAENRAPRLFSRPSPVASKSPSASVTSRKQTPSRSPLDAAATIFSPSALPTRIYSCFAAATAWKAPTKFFSTPRA